MSDDYVMILIPKARITLSLVEDMKVLGVDIIGPHGERLHLYPGEGVIKAVEVKFDLIGKVQL